MARQLHIFTQAEHGNGARDKSHQALEVAIRTHPRAECREDSNRGEYSVWDGPDEGPREGQAPVVVEAAAAPSGDGLTDAQLDALATRIAAKLKG